MYTLAVCAEMVFRDLPIEDRARRIHEAGFQVEIWDWTRHDLNALAKTPAEFSSMTGYIRGTLTDPDGAAELLRTAEESIKAAEHLGCPRLNRHGTGNYPAVARALTDLGYDGTVALEAWPSGDSHTAMERFRAAFTL